LIGFYVKPLASSGDFVSMFLVRVPHV
jgi:hypothetical protein